MEIVAIGLVLLLLSRSSSEQQRQQDPQPPPDGAGTGKPGEELSLSGLISGGVTVAGLIVKGVAGAGGTAGTTAAAAAGGGAAVAAGGAVGVVMVALLANPMAWAIYILIGTIVSRHNEIAKNFFDATRNMAPNARAMHEYERWLFEEFRQNNALPTLSLKEVRDGRLDKRWREGNGSVTLQGWRTVVSALYPPPSKTGAQANPLQTREGMTAVFRRMRAAAMIYLQERGGYGYAIAVNKPGFPSPPSTPEGWGLDDFNLNQRYDLNEPGLGGLLNVPLLSGEVERGYREEEENPYPPVDQLRAAPGSDPLFEGLQESDVQAARFAALVDAITLFRWDQTIDLREPSAWANDLFRWLGQPTGLERSGRTWITDPARYGGRYVIDVWAAKTGQGRVIST